jgi:hypothetical protein
MKLAVWLVGPCLAAASIAPASPQEPDPARAEPAALSARQDVVESLLAAAEAQLGRALPAGFRDGLKARLAALPEPAWHELERTRDLSSAARALGGSPASGRLVYHTVPPCRILDTRQVGGSLAPATPRSFQATGINLDVQGGNPAGCNVPVGAVGALINFVAVNPTGAGNLRAWAFGAGIPTASVLNYAAVGLNIANGIAIPICDPDPSPLACTRDFNVQADVSGTHLVADVVGYFEKLPGSSLTVASGPGGTVPVAVTCTHATGAAVTVTAPAAGKVLVHAQARLSFVSATDVTTYVGASTIDCSHAEGSFFVLYPNGVSGTWDVSAPTWGVFPVAAGTHTFYLNATKNASMPGRVVNVFRDARFSALFIPD